jgi:hypothetical protein
MNTENTTITGIPSVTDYIVQANKIDTLNRTNGQLIQQINDLKKDKEELEAKQPQVKVTYTNKSDGLLYWTGSVWGNTSTSSLDKVEYFNLSTVEENIRKDLEAKYESDLRELKELNIKIKNLEEDADLLKEQHERVIEKLSEAEQRNFEDMVDEKNKLIAKLKEDYKKLKDNNTDAAKELKRQSELSKLQKQLRLVKEENQRLNRLSLFGKLFDREARRANREFQLKLKELEQCVYTLYFDPEQENFYF